MADGIGWQVFVQRIGIERLHIAGRFGSAGRASANGAQADARCRGQLDPIHGQAQAPGEVAEQAEALAGFHDEEAAADKWP